MRIFSKNEDRSVNELIQEQREKEAIAVLRRGWCIQQAVSFSDECSAADVIRKAEEIYKYVYGDQ